MDVPMLSYCSNNFENNLHYLGTQQQQQQSTHNQQTVKRGYEECSTPNRSDSSLISTSQDCKLLELDFELLLNPNLCQARRFQITNYLNILEKRFPEMFKNRRQAPTSNFSDNPPADDGDKHKTCSSYQGGITPQQQAIHQQNTFNHHIIHPYINVFENASTREIEENCPPKRRDNSPGSTDSLHDTLHQLSPASSTRQYYEMPISEKANTSPTTQVSKPLPFPKKISSSAKSSKRIRTNFPPHVLAELESEFSSDIYCSVSRRIAIANRLGITARSVKYWFQNRRMRLKKL